MEIKKFRCTVNTINKLYDLFDNLMKDTEKREEIRKQNTISLKIGYDGKEEFASKHPMYGVINGTTEVVRLTDINELEFNRAYLFEPSDVARCDNGYGFIGFRREYVHDDNISLPTCVFRHDDVCSVREEYKDFVNNGYKTYALPEYFKGLMKNEGYKNFFKEKIKKECCVSRIFERNGGIFCGSSLSTMKGFNNLQGLEKEFYMGLLNCLLPIGKPVTSVYFYNDFNWTVMMVRPSKEVKGEYELVLK